MKMPSVVVVGGGFSGCAAAITAAKAGVTVTLIEKNDMLLGPGVRAGQVNANGDLVLAEESKALGGGDIFEGLESIMRHRAGMITEKHAYVYDAGLVEPTVKRIVEKAGVNVHLETRITAVRKKGNRVMAVKAESGETFRGEAFVDTTGGSGGLAACNKYGEGCVMCIHFRCLVFGDRVSIATLAGTPELTRARMNGKRGTIGAALCFYKETLSPELRTKLETEGVLTIPLPKRLIDYSKLKKIGAVRTKEQMENINLIDIGPVAKWAGAMYMPLKTIRTIPGFENVQIEDPPGGGKFNRIGGMSISQRDNTLRAKGLANVFVAGEKSGPTGGVAIAIATGALAGHNAARLAAGKPCITLPTTTTLGDFIAYVGEKMGNKDKFQTAYVTVAGEYFDRMVKLGLYTDDVDKIAQRIQEEGLTNSFSQKLL